MKSVKPGRGPSADADYEFCRKCGRRLPDGK